MAILMGENGSYYGLNRDVFLYLQDESAQILDFERGQFYGLDKIATLMVLLVLEKGVEEAVNELTKIYEVNQEIVRSDLTKLLHDLEQKQLFVTESKTHNYLLNLIRSYSQITNKICNKILLLLLKTVSSIFRNLVNPEPNPNRLTVELLLSLSWLSFRLLGWSRTVSLWQHWHGAISAADTTVTADVIQTIDRMVREAAASKLFLPMVCKERALVGYHLLRTFYGLPATLVIGINRYPFQVHAWVECNGLVVTDELAHCQPFTPVVRYS
ncbi:lasso peptide biosynthesis B2 protein [Nostoc sp. CENA67]|uniref:Lasso peptide biosynthesis B2 protein n=1 Tax=Amazonocrinis nigriterrae CENA67 TaxID=2794033 RepID=A0A8J7HZ97_9NOST|nr:lasso peptide biosynthesis B2 protein [Amazonocrinis nigriterrae]MBH8566118.1 lasso peptide biosynthesis B2 protein [Amazonocrinis nigriterrae CENA67]